jgi:hypothetical protein
VGLEQDEQFSDKWNLDLDIMESTSITGPNFASPGERIKGFAFESTPNFSPQLLEPGNVIVAQAEYVGDESGGAYRIKQIDDVLVSTPDL